MKRAFSFFLAPVLLLFLAIPAFALTPDITTEAEAYVVMEVSTGQVLIEKNPDKQMAPASITKIMTCALALREADPEQSVTMNHESVYSIPANTTHIALEEGETVTVRDLLHATMLLSANDAANGLAQAVSGDLDSFVAMMNAQVQELGLQNTHFANPHGLDNSEHYVSARDMASITRWALDIDGFRELFGTLEYDFPETNKKDRDYEFINQDAILHDVNTVYYEGVEGGKLGYTDNARHTIVTLAERDGMELICVALNSGNKTKYSDTAALLDYCFERYTSVEIPAKNLRSFSVPISDGENRVGQADIRAEADIALVVPAGVGARDLDYTYAVADFYLESEQHDPTLTISYQGETLVEVPLSCVIGQAAQIPMAQVQKEAAHSRAFDIVTGILKWTLIVCAVLTFLLFTTRFFVRRYYRTKRRRRRT